MTARFEPTKEQRDLVKALAAYGIRQDAICLLIKRPVKRGPPVPITLKTLRARFRRELDEGEPSLIAQVADSLVKRALDPKHPQGVAAAIFFLKARAGWSEKVKHELTGRNGGPIASVEFDLSDATDEELAVLERFFERKAKAMTTTPANDERAA